MATANQSIRDLRTALGLSRERLAAQVGVSVTWLGQLEREPSFLTRAMAQRLAAVLGTTPEAMLAPPRRGAKGVSDAR